MSNTCKLQIIDICLELSKKTKDLTKESVLEHIQTTHPDLFSKKFFTEKPVEKQINLFASKNAKELFDKNSDTLDITKITTQSKSGKITLKDVKNALDKSPDKDFKKLLSDKGLIYIESEKIPVNFLKKAISDEEITKTKTGMVNVLSVKKWWEANKTTTESDKSGSDTDSSDDED